MKTRTQVEKLKAVWLDDPTAFDLSQVEGFEEYREELLEFMKMNQEPPQEPPPNDMGLPPWLQNFVGTVSTWMMKDATRHFSEQRMKVEQILLEERLKQFALTGVTIDDIDFQQLGHDVAKDAEYFQQGQGQFYLGTKEDDCNCWLCTDRKMNGSDDSSK